MELAAQQLVLFARRRHAIVADALDGGLLLGRLLGVFLACVVEAVEALTLVLAVGTTRGWRSTWPGVGAALAVLAVMVAALGPARVYRRELTLR